MLLLAVRGENIRTTQISHLHLVLYPVTMTYSIGGSIVGACFVAVSQL